MSGEGGTGSDPANPQGQAVTMFTQDQVNHFNAEAKRGAVANYFKDAGYSQVPSAESLAATVAKASELDKLKEGQKGDVERLTSDLAAANEKAAKVPGLEVDLLRAGIAADAGLKSRYWKYVEGETAEDIEASVKAVLADVGGATPEGEADDDGGEDDQIEGEPQGKGRRPAPNPQQGRGGGSSPKSTMQSGADAYKAKHNKE